MITIFTIFTTILIIIFVFSLAMKWEDLAFGIALILIIGGLICWAGVGLTMESTAFGKVKPKSNYEILIGEDKIVVTNLYSKVTETFTDAATYNIISKNKDKYYVEISTYDMYGNKIKTYIMVKDSRYPISN